MASEPPKIPSVQEVAQRFGITDSKFLTGQVVTKELDATNDKDLSLLVIAVIDADVETCWEFVNNEKLSSIQSATMDEGEIDLTDPATTFESLTLEDEAMAKLDKNPGGLYFMSKEEAKIMTSNKGNTLNGLRQVLLGRARAYWEQGLAGILPYQGSKNRDPRVDLQHANEYAMNVVENPWIQEEILAVPAVAAAKHRDDDERDGQEVRHTMGWTIQKGRDLAAPTLNHYIRIKRNNSMASITRRFYSGYDYDASQIVTAILPTNEEGRSVCFYTNHTYTAKVAGFGGSGKRAIGRKMMVGKLVETMQRAQVELAKK